MTNMFIKSRAIPKYMITLLIGVIVGIILCGDKISEMCRLNSSTQEQKMTNPAYIATHHTSSMNKFPKVDSTQHYTFEHWEWFPVEAKPPSSFHSEFLINPVNLCQSPSQLDYIFLVHTAVNHSSHRQAVRDTFGQRHLYNMTSRAVFVVGTTPNLTVSGELRAEADIHGDIVQGDFVDSYHNLTLKGVAGLRWLAEHCTNTRYVLKIDDDVIVHLHQVVLRIFPILDSALKTRSHTLVCPVALKGGIFRRSQGIKWVVADNEFPGLIKYPFYHCHGFVAMFTVDLAVAMLEAAKVVPFFWIDDVYLFGLLPFTIGDVQFVDMPYHVFGSYESAKPCYVTFGQNCPYTVVFDSYSYFNKTNVLQFWKMMNKNVWLADPEITFLKPK